MKSSIVVVAVMLALCGVAIAAEGNKTFAEIRAGLTNTITNEKSNGSSSSGSTGAVNGSIASQSASNYNKVLSDKAAVDASLNGRVNTARAVLNSEVSKTKSANNSLNSYISQLSSRVYAIERKAGIR